MLGNVVNLSDLESVTIQESIEEEMEEEFEDSGFTSSENGSIMSVEQVQNDITKLAKTSFSQRQDVKSKRAIFGKANKLTNETAEL